MLFSLVFSIFDTMVARSLAISTELGGVRFFGRICGASWPMLGYRTSVVHLPTYGRLLCLTIQPWVYNPASNPRIPTLPNVKVSAPWAMAGASVESSGLSHLYARTVTRAHSYTHWMLARMDKEHTAPLSWFNKLAAIPKSVAFVKLTSQTNSPFVLDRGFFFPTSYLPAVSVLASKRPFPRGIGFGETVGTGKTSGRAFAGIQ